nr:F-box and FNIP repeat-containing protein [Megavirus caiporensis]
MIDLFYGDIIMYLLYFLSDIDKINLCSINKKFSSFRNDIVFDDIYSYYDVIEAPFGKFSKIKYYAHNTNIPDGVTHLIFRDRFNECIKGCIPDSVRQITFGKNFNQDIRDCIPNGVTHLTFGDNFNQNVKDCIPSSVIYLTFGRYFNQAIKNCIPKNVTHLIFGIHFNQDIKDCIPNSITHLTLGHEFNQDIRGCIPDTIVHFIFNENLANKIFSSKINDSIYEYIPKNVEYFPTYFFPKKKFKTIFSRKKIQAIFPKYTRLEVARFVDHKNDNELELYSRSINNDTIPSNIKKLYISKSDQSISDYLPDSLIKLYIHNFSGKFEKPLPSSLKYLVINYEFNQPIQGLISDKIRYLVLGNEFYQSIENCLPKNLRYLGITEKCYELNKKFINENIYVEFIDKCTINTQSGFKFDNL